MAEDEAKGAGRDMNITCCALTGAAVVAVIFAVYWTRAALETSLGPHISVALFSPAVDLTPAALGTAFILSILFGALVGALSAFFHNLFVPRA